MKYHAAVKFIAIFLCAVCLLGAVGSAAGVLVLTELDLYNQTVDQMLDNGIQESGYWFARSAAKYYASLELGGCPVELVRQNRADPETVSISVSRPGKFGFAVFDGEGNIVHDAAGAFRESGKTYTFPVTGVEYQYLISQEPVTQAEPEELPEVLGSVTPGEILKGEFGVYNNLPDEGSVTVYGITVGYADGSSEGYGSADGFGELFRVTAGDDKNVIFASTQTGELDGLGAAGKITSISFQDERGMVLYEAAGPGTVGEVIRNGSWLTFMSTITDAMEPEGTMDVYYAQVFSLEEPETVDFEIIGGDNVIGQAWYDEDGQLFFSVPALDSVGVLGRLTEELDQETVGGIRLYDAQERLLFRYDGTGTVDIGRDHTLVYQSDEPVIGQASVAMGRMAEASEPVPEATLSSRETLPAATAATKATEVTVPQTMETVFPQVTEATIPQTTAPVETVPAEAVAAGAAEQEMLNGRPLSDYEQDVITYYDPEQRTDMQARCAYVPLTDYTVELYINESAVRGGVACELLRIVRNLRNDLFLILGVSVLLFAIFIVYLCCAAGHRPKTTEIRAGGLCRVPLDLNLAATGCAVAGVVVGIVGCVNYVVEQNQEGLITLGVELAFLGCLCLVGFFYAAAAQFKTPDGYWWRNSLCFRVLSGSVHCVAGLYRWLTGRFFPWLGRVLKTVWKFGSRVVLALWLFLERCVKKAAGWIGGGIRKFIGLLPLTWQWLVAAFVLIFLLTIATATGSVVLMLICIALAVGLALYVSLCFGTLLDGVRRMNSGNLESKVDDKRMVGCFREFAGDLNDLADVAVVAAQKQLKSERMKTELITNVSHDIKTPLTSIINYVDLLQKPHSGEEEAMYLDVLARQSQRLKKLIEDLMEMSKASTGNMSVDIIELDAVEVVNQALGEFGDKLEKAQLVPVFRHGEETVRMMADGRLVWRVFSNLLGNAVKYAMPGTRLYIDLMQLEGKVVISLKNISRDELNVEAEELMERFVRGDDSRNTEGSGLGLNIARSLMELQKGQLQLLVDGDLFKVTLIFPGV